MASDAMTSNKLIASVENRAHVPVSQSTFDVQNFLDFATEELRLGMTPFIMSMNQDYFLIEIEAPLVTGKNEYKIPSRATGIKLKDLQLKDSNGGYQELTRTSIGERFDSSGNEYMGELNKFYLKNDKVVLCGEVNSTNKTLVFVVYMKPSRLVQEERVGIISGINRTTGVIVVDQIPEVFTTQEKYDLYKASSPFNVLKIDFSINSINVSTNTITLSEIPDDLEIGDHISLANEAIIPQIPEELHVMLAQMIACRVMESQGDTEGLRNAQVKLEQMKQSAGTIIDNRVTDAPRKVINRNGLLRSSSYNRYNRR